MDRICELHPICCFNEIIKNKSPELLLQLKTNNRSDTRQLYTSSKSSYAVPKYRTRIFEHLYIYNIMIIVNILPINLYLHK